MRYVKMLHEAQLEKAYAEGFWDAFLGNNNAPDLEAARKRVADLLALQVAPGPPDLAGRLRNFLKK